MYKDFATYACNHGYTSQLKKPKFHKLLKEGCTEVTEFEVVS